MKGKHKRILGNILLVVFLIAMWTWNIYNFISMPIDVILILIGLISGFGIVSYIIFKLISAKD